MEVEDKDTEECRLQIQLFGAFDVRVKGVAIPPLRSRKVQWLLALLVLRHDQSLDRVWLAGTLWPESAPTQALGNLRQSLSNLRHALGEDCLCLHSPTVNSLSLDVAHADVDVLHFDAALKSGDAAALERAVALYRGPLLEGCAEDWMIIERRVREESYLRALEQLADLARACEDRSLAVKYLRLAAHADPFRETTQRVLIQALAEAGDYSAAVQTYRDLRLLLRRELNSDPDPETVTLFEQIRQQARPRTPVRPARRILSGETRAASARHLPLPLTALVGRRSELNEILAALRQSRLLTLTGPGGVGKTRLAIAAAEELAEEYPEGVFFVDLAPLTNPDLIALTVAAALQVREEPGRLTLATLQTHLQARSLLLLLDNCEHLLEGCAHLAEALLSTCPGVRILATSQHALRLTGERRWTVPSLTMPARMELTGKDRSLHKDWLAFLSEYEAIQLFIVRAQQVAPAFRMSADNGETIAEICIQLDGIPLAIELAAARIYSLSVKEINRNLNQRFRLLTRGSRAARPRHQTLRALIDWSYDLLNEQEKTLLARLSVFVGGWSVEAAETVCAGASGTGAGVEDWEVLDLLTGLVDKSLVVFEDAWGQDGRDDPPRYRMLESIGQYAADRREENGETATFQRQHRDWFLRLAEEVRPKLSGSAQRETLDLLETEHANLHAALTWCEQQAAAGEGDAGLRLSAALQQFWMTRGYPAEGRYFFDALLAHTQGQPGTPACADALNGAGVLAWMQGDFAATRALHEQSLAINRKLGNKRGMAASLSNLGGVTKAQGDYPAAGALFEEGLALRRELGDKQGVAKALNNLGTMTQEQGDYPAARALYGASLDIYRELVDKQGIALSLGNLGVVAYSQGDYPAARALQEESLALRRELGDKHGMGYSLGNLGIVAQEQGDYPAARTLFEESLALRRELGDKHGIAHSLGNLGVVAYSQGDYPAARALQEESLAINREIGDKWDMAYSLGNLGNVVYRQGDFAAARVLHEQSLAINREIGNQQGIALSLVNLEALWCALNNPHGAQVCLRECLTLCRDLRDKNMTCYALEGYAALATQQPQPARAVCLYGAAHRLRETLGVPLPPNERDEHDQHRTDLKHTLGEADYETAWNEGAVLTWEQAIEYALSQAGSTLKR